MRAAADSFPIFSKECFGVAETICTNSVDSRSHGLTKSQTGWWPVWAAISHSLGAKRLLQSSAKVLDMKINDQGFTERLSPQTGRTGSVDQQDSSSGPKSTGNGSSFDVLQLSGLASRLQASSSGDASRSLRLNEIAGSVRSNTFQVNSGQISGAMVSEAIQASAR